MSGTRIKEENNACCLSKELDVNILWQKDETSRGEIIQDAPVLEMKSGSKPAQLHQLDSKWYNSSSVNGNTVTPRPYTKCNHSTMNTCKEGKSIETQDCQAKDFKAIPYSTNCTPKAKGGKKAKKILTDKRLASPKTLGMTRQMRDLLAGAAWHLRDNPEYFSSRHQRTRLTQPNDPSYFQESKTSQAIDTGSKKAKKESERRRRKQLKAEPKEVCLTIENTELPRVENQLETPDEHAILEEPSKRFRKKIWFIDYDPHNKNQSVLIGNRKFFVDEIYEKHESPVTISNAKSAFDLVNETKNRYWNDENLPPTAVYLSMPVSSYREKYQLSFPKDEELNPFEEIGRMMEISALFYLPLEYASLVRNEESFANCIVGQFIKAYEKSHYEIILKKIDEYNILIDSLRSSGVIFDHIRAQRRVPRPIIYEVLNQVYSRTVSPNSKKLRQYKAFSNYVYGELLPNFLTQAFNEVKLDSSSKFIDLGSGVGNCVFQAALEYGCESFGCEIMEHASFLSELQLVEFKTRCDIFGIKPGKVEFFLRQTFEDNLQVSEVVSKCEVILVNNYLFDATLNSKVISLFQCLKESIGTKIVSLKPVIPLNYTIHDDLTLTNVLSFMKTRRYVYSENSVSWTCKGGVYYLTEVVSDIPIELMGSSTRQSKSHN
ncbi:BA75_03361T0 [Komagataella pastoris]|uniref:Histone-lysine N-methyltransferase, H3 lysine-79 specific n=1 Tax=Komagataella pastoris TaxID=4922 RepID=A0A1B2JEY9_PICPA|nr:BA75_03361T0 [Komagataella pastoris]